VRSSVFVIGVDVAAVLDLSAHAGAGMHVDQFVVAGVADQGGRSCDLECLAGNHGSDHLAFDEHIVRFQAGVFDHARGADVKRAAGVKRDVPFELSIDLDALVLGGVEVALEYRTLGNQAGDGAQALGGHEAGAGGVLAHGVRAPCCATSFRV
jgi:hypothetical protein